VSVCQWSCRAIKWYQPPCAGNVFRQPLITASQSRAAALLMCGCSTAEHCQEMVRQLAKALAARLDPPLGEKVGCLLPLQLAAAGCRLARSNRVWPVAANWLPGMELAGVNHRPRCSGGWVSVGVNAFCSPSIGFG
jgi:hypothetical protein